MLNFLSSKADAFLIGRIELVARGLRQSEATYWDNEPFWSLGKCSSISEKLAVTLTARDLPAKRVGGYYIKCEDTYPALVEKHSPSGLPQDFDFNTWDNTWKHWWVECYGFVVDITADQFHPTHPHLYEIVILPRPRALAYSSLPLKITAPA